MLHVKSLSKAYDKPVLTNFSYVFPDKGLFLIRGNSGIGKTTLLRLIARLEKPDSGTILSDHKQVSVLFQEDRLLPFRSLMDNILIVKKEKNLDKARSLLKKFGLEDAADQYPDSLSGGMKLRGAIVRSLYYGGDLYLWDEPTKELDPENRSLVIEALHELSEKALVIVVTHDKEITGGCEILL